MSTNPQQTEFYFNSVLWREIPLERGASIKEIGALLCQHLSLSNYGNGVVQINFIPIIVRSSNKVHETSYRYMEDSLVLDAEVRLDYEKAFNIKDDEIAFKGLIANSFLHALQQLESLKVHNFNFNLLISDIENLFESQGWMIAA